MEKHFRRTALGSAMVHTYLRDSLSVFGSESPVEDGNYIVLFGGELSNKGAQAMTFTVTDQLSRRFPEKQVCLFSTEDYNRDDADKYAFEIHPYTRFDEARLLSSWAPVTDRSGIPDDVAATARDRIENASMIVDISGYALSSQWSIEKSIAYMGNVMLAKKHGIPMYVFPQSIGPFEYPAFVRPFLGRLFDSYLPYLEIICPREQLGVEYLSRYTTDNVSLEFDIVLQYDEYDLDNVFDSVPDFRDVEVDDAAVGIVPNRELYRATDENRFYSLYSTVVETVVNNDKSVYILRHSQEDADVCERIGELFEDENDVVVLSEDYNAIELEGIIDQFDYLVGSRYHSIVHSYKSGTPVVAIGWAVKYASLLQSFAQGEYFIDGRRQINDSEVVATVEAMDEAYESEADIVDRKRNQIQQSDLVTSLFGEDGSP